MCIIVVKPENVRVPSRKTLFRCWERNDHGAGFMYPGNDGQVHIAKGFLEFDPLWESIKNFPKHLPLVIHFRLASHGEISIGNCHPFPLDRDWGKLGDARQKCNVAICHNGIIPHLGENGKCDTRVLAQALAPYGENVVGDELQTILTVLAKNADRFATMDGRGNIHTFGHFYHDDEDGCSYSNTGYQECGVDRLLTSRLFTDYEDTDCTTCPVCGSPITADQCDNCLTDFSLARNNTCPACGYQKYDIQNDMCPDCLCGGYLELLAER